MDTIDTTAGAAAGARRPSRRRRRQGLDRRCRGAGALSGRGAPAVPRPLRRRRPAGLDRGGGAGRRTVRRSGHCRSLPHGGNTGLVGGGVPRGGIVLSTARLDRIRAIDPVNRTMTRRSRRHPGRRAGGCRRSADALFPLSLAAEGSCRIGGNLATNAGGLNVLRYGNARDLVLGLEVVLPDGRIWDGLTRAAQEQHRLRPQAALPRLGGDARHHHRRRAQAVRQAADQRDGAGRRCRRSRRRSSCSHRLNDAVGDALTAFELISRIGLDFCLSTSPTAIDPFDGPHPWYVLLKADQPAPQRSAARCARGRRWPRRSRTGSSLDAVIAAERQRRRDELWRIRESIPEAQKPEGGSIKNDVSVPLSRVAEFIAARQRGGRGGAAGHPRRRLRPLGDGNIHFNLSQPPACRQSRLSRRVGPHRADRLRHRGGPGRQLLGRARHRPAEARQPAAATSSRSRST